MALDYTGTVLENAPSWLLQPYGAAWLSAFGGGRDAMSAVVRDAVLARMPVYSPPDALPLIGEERGLPRGPGESAATYATRLAKALQAWAWAGTPYGLLTAMYLAGFPAVRLGCQSGKQYVLNLVGSTFTPTGDPALDMTVSNLAAPVHLGGSPECWPDFSVLIVKPWPTSWGGTPPADGSPDCLTAQSVIRSWKGAVNRCVKLSAVDGPLWGTGTWGSVGAYGTGTVVNWTPPTG